jgi:hypothetical protein
VLRSPKTSPRMTAARRRSLPRSAFALPSERAYPLDTPGRAINAKARATQMEEKGYLSPSQARQIRARANRRLAKRRLGKRR